ncbi:TPA: DUF2726 domain-containing protein [Campylobacter fetus subsp. venerealis]|nr:DUF2726 domain-containing protein [Campylobacter fetus subsp. venerealis]HDX6324079.1 DUF2726 domain-containing protein [Campylobacter fetus subsp. venerealis]
MANVKSSVNEIIKDTFYGKRVINLSEEIIFKALIEANNNTKAHFAISPQVSFSQFIRCENKVNWHKYKTFSVDFLVWDRDSRIPLLVVEYHGGGHYGGDEYNTFVDKNDLIKFTILEKAGIEFVIIDDEEISLKTTMEKNKKKGALWHKFCDIFEELQKELPQIRQKYKETEERNRAKNKKTK